jgi:hypothetical protein
VFETYLQSIADRDEKYVSYARDLLEYIQSSKISNRPFYATHSHCTDGGVAGAMIRYAIPEAAIIPMDYWMINDPNFAPLLESIEWKGIVDLKPFSTNRLDFWVDHHLSARGSAANADRIRFDIDGDSGSYQLLLSDFLGPLPEHLVEIAVMTRITDTAGYTTQPPADRVSSLSDLDAAEDSATGNESRIWLLDDVWGSTYTLKQHLDLYNILAKDGFRGLSSALDRVNTLREVRRAAYDVADQIPVHEVVAFQFQEDSQDKFTILRRLQSNGVKVAISLSLTVEGTVKISFRRNRFLTEDENNLIQVNTIAEKINGGGHAGASGAFHENVESAVELIAKWCDELGLEFHREIL